MSAIERLRNWRRRVWGFNTYNRRQWVAQQAVQIPAGARVLDVGAGIGQYRPLFGHCEYRAHDFAQEPGTLGKYTELDYQSDITAIPVPNESFDVILCTEVLEHVPEPIKAVYEMARILRPGGRLLLTAPLGSLLHQQPYHYYGGYTPDWYHKFLSAAGFEIESIEANQGFFSLFGQETQRYSTYLDPGCNWQLGPRKWSLLVLMWLVIWPLSQVLPLIGYWLDRFELENVSTAGYHVTAVRNTHRPA